MIMLHRNDASFAALIDGDGEVTDFMRLPGIIFSKRARNPEDRKAKVLPSLLPLYFLSSLHLTCSVHIHI